MSSIAGGCYAAVLLQASAFIFNDQDIKRRKDYFSRSMDEAAKDLAKGMGYHTNKEKENTARKSGARQSGPLWAV